MFLRYDLFVFWALTTLIGKFYSQKMDESNIDFISKLWVICTIDYRQLLAKKVILKSEKLSWYCLILAKNFAYGICLQLNFVPQVQFLYSIRTCCRFNSLKLKDSNQTDDISYFFVLLSWNLKSLLLYCRNMWGKHCGPNVGLINCFPRQIWFSLHYRKTTNNESNA